MRPALARRLGRVVALLAVASCGGSPAAPACPTFPTTCTSPPGPSYATDVAPIIQARCATANCHSPTGMEPNRPYQTYTEISKFQIDILIQVRACRMPPAGAEPLSMDEQATLLAWLYCGGMDN
ncbi:MAG TPA: hypothetical protein VHL80_10605 [Polyangia bacterium]|nr:hypothetical protein [Polyangia bacterium]